MLKKFFIITAVFFTFFASNTIAQYDDNSYDDAPAVDYGDNYDYESEDQPNKARTKEIFNNSLVDQKYEEENSAPVQAFDEPPTQQYSEENYDNVDSGDYD